MQLLAGREESLSQLEHFHVLSDHFQIYPNLSTLRDRYHGVTMRMGEIEGHGRLFRPKICQCRLSGGSRTELDAGRGEAEIESQDKPQPSVGKYIPFAVLPSKKSGSPFTFRLIEPVQTPAVLSTLTSEGQRPEINCRGRKRPAAYARHLE